MARRLINVAKAIVGGALAASLLWMLGTAVLTPMPPLSFLAGLGVTFLAALIGASTLGLGWHTLASRQGWRSVHAYWAPGAIAGAMLPTAMLVVPATLQPPAAGGYSAFSALLFVLAISGALLGGIAGLVAWLIRRPDRDPPNPTTSAK